MTELGQGTRLGEKSRACPDSSRWGPDDLDRELTLELRIPSAIHNAHSTSADLTLQRVPTDVGPGRGWHAGIAGGCPGLRLSCSRSGRIVGHRQRPYRTVPL